MQYLNTFMQGKNEEHKRQERIPQFKMMNATYDDYQREYQANLSRIRRFLAGTRNRSTLTECDRLLNEAKKCATAMQAMAEIENNALKVTEARQLIERDIGPLVKEVQRTLQAMGRDELFATSSSSQYQAPNDSMNHSRNYNNNNNSDMDSLIQSSEDLLRESQSILIETEYIGNQTLHQMGRQRDQLQNADDSLAAVQNAAATAARTLKKMSLRACRSRLALHVMIVLLIAANFLALYHVYKKHHRSSSTPPPGTL